MTALLFMVGFAAPFVLFGIACVVTAIADQVISRRAGRQS